MARKKEISGIQIGMSSMVLIFVVLCLTIFAVLSLMSSMSDMRIAEKSLEATRNYYRADSIAETKLKDADTAIREAMAASGSKDFATSLHDKLGDMYDPATGHIRYEVEINANQMLCVELAVINSAKAGEKRYNILKWQEVNTGDYVIDDKLPVWTGDEFL